MLLTVCDSMKMPSLYDKRKKNKKLRNIRNNTATA